MHVCFSELVSGNTCQGWARTIASDCGVWSLSTSYLLEVSFVPGLRLEVAPKRKCLKQHHESGKSQH